ncbi:MAG: esterase-like activity of phytase family protein [Opitutaceae bacterium]|nr:esterase-like activity of phytase family protein [Opitutaceae bacterium]
MLFFRFPACLAFLALLPPFVSAQPVTTVTLNGRAFVNHGLVGVGRLPANARDKFGETFGSFSALALDARAWQRAAGGAYTGTLWAQPDRGASLSGTTNYTPRVNRLTFTFTPAPAGAATQTQLALVLADAIKFTEASGTPLTALDPTLTGAGTRAGFPPLPQAFNGRISLDAEGLVLLPDGSFWVSDEYGPSLYKFDAAGRLLTAIRPPDAFIPRRNGADSFSSDDPARGQPHAVPVDPETGRQNNQGFEGLSLSPDGRTLFALLQSATRQDGGAGGGSARRLFTRLVAYDLTTTPPSLRGEYVLQLPTYTRGGDRRVAAQSELFAINSTQFLVLAQEAGAGRGGDLPASTLRQILIYDLTGATNVAGTAYDSPATPLAPNGVLAPGLVAAQGVPFIDLNDAAQLAKFGLHNGPADDAQNLSSKWESLALAPALDPAAPNDWFLFVGNDNDFITQTGFQNGTAFADASGLEVDSMILVYRLTLPSRVINLSSRALAGGAAGAHIVGFVVTGARPKPILIRAIGPTLAAFGDGGALADSLLTLFNADGRMIAVNDNWNDAPNLADLRLATGATGAFALPEGSKDAALLLTLDPGLYTVHATGVGNASGQSLVEFYEVP